MSKVTSESVSVQSKALENVGMYILHLFTNFIAKARPSFLVSVTQIEKKNRAEHLREAFCS